MARVLCLHGGGSNATVMNHQVGKLRHALPKWTFLAMNGPRQWPLEKVDPMIVSTFGDGPYYGWYGVEDDGPAHMSFIEKLEDQRVNFTYTEVDTALQQIQDYIADNGPFDILCGFSQGAIVITLLTAILLNKAREGQGPGPSWSHNLLFSGIPPRDDAYRALFPAVTTQNAPLQFPTTLIYGKKDPFYRYGQRLREIYDKPIVFEHEEGHKFPAKKEFNEGLVRHIETALLQSSGLR